MIANAPRPLVKPIDLRRRSTQRLAILASLALVVLAVAASLIIVQGIDAQMRDVSHTYEVRNQARELTTSLGEAESSQRGYVLTGDESYLEPFRRSEASIRSRVLSLGALTEADATQTAMVQQVAGQIDAKIAEMEDTVNLVLNGRETEARRIIEAGVGGQLMASVRTALEEFIAEENSKLLARNRSIDDARRWLVGAIVLALAAAVLLSYALLTRTRREVNALAISTDLLVSENEELEAHVRERTQAFEEARAHAERERQRVEALLQDTNHRIGNSLATVSSLLGLQMLRTRSEEVRQALEAARSRVHAIASAHRRLRLGEDMETASTDEFLDAVVEDIANTAAQSRNVTIVSEIEAITVSSRDATTVGILVSELVTNALKHAFPDERRGTVTVKLGRNGQGVATLWVIDDGIGMPSPISSDGGLGSVIVTQLSNQFSGAPDYSQRDGGGLVVTVPLPNIEVQGTEKPNES